MGKKNNLSEIDCWMIVSARQGVLSILETADLGSAQQSLEFAEDGAKKKKNIQRAAVLPAEKHC